MDERQIDLLLGEVAFKETIPLLVRVSEGDSSLTKKMLARFKAFRDALRAKNAPADDDPLEAWMTWAEIKE